VSSSDLSTDRGSRFIVGIDLGTTHCALAEVSIAGSDAAPLLMAIPQVVALSTVAEEPLLPSALYLPGEHELPPGALTLPWGEPAVGVGRFAREQGARVPGRLVTSAKSWLSHGGVDRAAAVLPWGADDEVARLSPVAASALLLRHLAQAWEQRHPGLQLADQQLVVTVPASFDEGARALTLQAAAEAGLGEPALLEEPLAAFYDALAGGSVALPDDARTETVLVVDVGGGTTDFTLLRCGGGRVERVAVGDHLLLGGDNIDLALARLAEGRLGSERLDAAAWASAVHGARTVKERLLADDAPESASLTVAGRSSRLLGGLRSVAVGRDELRQRVLDGFFPLVEREARPESSSGLRALGLPYPRDPAITRHLAAFLERHLAPQAGVERVDAVLFNGGTMLPSLLRERVVAQCAAWFGAAPRVIPARSLEQAVALGAVRYGLAQRGQGLRVEAGAARSYFVAVDTREGPVGVCVVPRGTPSGERVVLPEQRFALAIGRPVRFEVWSSSDAATYRPGDRVALGGPSLVRLPPLQTIVQAGAGQTGAREASLEAGVTELGTLAIHCVAGEERFKLEFAMRGAEGGAGVLATGLSGAVPRRLDEVRGLVEKFYGKKPSGADVREVKGLFKALEAVLGPREAWGLALLRELWALLWECAARRRRSADHERQWLMLTGYALRPGFGAPLDDWRVAETFTLFSQGLQFHQEHAAWDQWWVFWRRLSGGLSESAQAEVLEFARYWLEPVPAGRTRPRPKGPRVEGMDELVRLVASLERLSPARKVELGGWLWARLAAGHAGCVWALGRVGARVPLHGSAHQVIAPAVAESWLDQLASLAKVDAREVAFASAVIGRATGDRATDISDDARGRLLERLAKARAPEGWLAMVREPLVLAQADEQRLLGEGLPAGLSLLD